MTHSWRTAWQAQDIVIYRDEVEVDRIAAQSIDRVVFVYAGSGDSVGDLVHALVETGEHVVILPAATGFGGRVNFERLDYWAQRGCVFWVHQSQARLPLRLRRGRWWLGLAAPGFARVPRQDLAALLERWPLEGPQTWEQRKWRRIERRRPFGKPDDEQRARA